MNEITIKTKKTTHKVEDKYGNDAFNLLYDDLWRTAFMEDYYATEGKNKQIRETARIKAATIRWVYSVMKRIAEELEEELSGGITLEL